MDQQETLQFIQQQDFKLLVNTEQKSACIIYHKEPASLPVTVTYESADQALYADFSDGTRRNIASGLRAEIAEILSPFEEITFILVTEVKDGEAVAGGGYKVPFFVI